MTAVFSTESFSSIVHFVTAANSSSFTQAAEQLGISKSAIGKSIQRLEHNLGISLFNRTTRKIGLTTEGEAYLASCQSALETLQMAEMALRSKLTEPSGTVRIDLPAAFGRSVMMPILMNMTKRYPYLKLTITFNDRIIDLLDVGIDLAIRFGPLKDTTELIARKLNDQHLIICASPDYISTYGTPETLIDLAHHRCILAWRGGAPLSWLIRDEHGKDIRHKPAPFHQISDGDAMIDACIAGAGLIQFPEALLRPHIQSGKLVPLLAAWNPDPTELNVIWPRARHLLPGVRFIIDELITLAAQNVFE
ncbi:LysR family transcriptional regulator [Pseudohongiella nitratireducens]|uniref:LysR family transcriptional regulator n=1 Tax=Pseudohongiella nitratireducens TaxID=1768907 RepID=UPI002409C881|nr:LysR family transcriptional regulator [Pseudohongiella nitratireducens]MDF1624423.1 LysR family transcriptional regulator [Pseudohongiella nitratireducens]|tara:strand:+ start:7005 stop:7925 length:921 start_codon:yes stop_codon:yes gene_type:complete